MQDLLAPVFAPEAAFTVGDLNAHIKRVLQADPILCDIAVAGEISNFKHHSSGHCYFSLKDDHNQISAKMWRSSVARLGFRPANGDKVLAFGEVDYYGARGETSLIVRQLHFAGQGEMFEAFERLKLALAEEGLFDPERKLQLPHLPRRIGVITSPTGAVIRDILTVLSRRYPLATVVLIPAAVQGFSAPMDLTRALSFAEALGDLDVLIVARGGGSAEDLWCFNDEELARAAADCALPLISAVGHETDFTILDFVADRRAATPSAAAELVAPDVRELMGYVAGLKLRAAQVASGDIRLMRQKLDYLKKSRSLSNPAGQIAQLRDGVAALRARAAEAASCHVKIERARLDGARLQLRALDPRRVLERGYAFLTDEQTGAIVSSLADVQSGQSLVVSLADGEFKVDVR